MHTENSRRKFFKQMIAGAATLTGVQLFNGCREHVPLRIEGTLLGANSKTGHLLRKNISRAPSKQIETNILIVGSGIAGLSARRWLQKLNVTGVLMVELDENIGGNSTYGKNSVSAYPWAAHYLPVADVRNQELIDFLVESRAITGFDEQELPFYNDYFMCHDPEERLFINGYWQEGIVPDFGIGDADRKEIQQFFSEMEHFKNSIGSDGKDAFRIPVDQSSLDKQYTALDGISFAQWLEERNYRSPALLWYLEYGCKDDYGCDLAVTSAWAGIHYFASRKGRAANADHATVLTWPEGNGYLMRKLKEQSNSEILTHTLAHSIRMENGKIITRVVHAPKDDVYEIRSNKILLATPQFINSRLLKEVGDASQIALRNEFEYAPWVVGNITLNKLPDVKGMPLCWDNVFYQQPSVGYVNANHQDVKASAKRVLTYYKPLVGASIKEERLRAYRYSYDDLQKMILNEMEYAHKGITKHIERLDIWVWGHGMIAPKPGFIWGNSRKAAQQPLEDKIFFAHSDLGGISIFEEAFYQGIRAAEELYKTL